MKSPRLFVLALSGVAAFSTAGCKKHSDTAATRDVAMTPAEVTISTVELGRHVGPDKRISDPTERFSPRDTIYASVATNGTAPSATVTARWTYADQRIVKEDSRTVSPNGTEATEFHISKPTGWPKGKYKVTISLGASTQSRDFEVK
jgi:hypothetical protein